jgi:hypothetical protein
MRKLSWGPELKLILPKLDVCSYRGRKRAAIELTRFLLGEQTGLTAAAAVFETCKKKDDLGDAFLHALACCVLGPPSQSQIP